MPDPSHEDHREGEADDAQPGVLSGASNEPSACDEEEEQDFHDPNGLIVLLDFLVDLHVLLGGSRGFANGDDGEGFEYFQGCVGVKGSM